MSALLPPWIMNMLLICNTGAPVCVALLLPLLVEEKKSDKPDKNENVSLLLGMMIAVLLLCALTNGAMLLAKLHGL